MIYLIYVAMFIRINFTGEGGGGSNFFPQERARSKYKFAFNYTLVLGGLVSQNSNIPTYRCMFYSLFNLSLSLSLSLSLYVFSFFSLFLYPLFLLSISIPLSLSLSFSISDGDPGKNRFLEILDRCKMAP